MRDHLPYSSVWLCLLLLGGGCGKTSQTPMVGYPQKPIKLIVPFDPGGGSDSFARILQKAFDDHQLLPQPLVVINVPGAGATVGSRRVKNARPDGYTLLLLHEAILTAKYAGRANYGPEAFELIAGAGEVGLVIAVAEDSKYQSLSDLMEAAKQQPESVSFSVNIGAPTHFLGLMLEKAKPGATFRYVQNGGGAKRFGSIMGGHCEVSAFSLAEYMQFKSGGLKALAVCSPERHPNLPEVPSALEQGFDVEASNMHFLWAPKGTDSAKLEVIANALEKAMQTKQVRERLEKDRMDPIFMKGDALRASIDDRALRIASVSLRKTVDLPNYPLIMFVAVLVLGTIAGWEFVAQNRNAAISQEPESELESSSITRSSTRWSAIFSMALTVGYVVVLQTQLSGFRSATIIYVVAVGFLLSGFNRRMLPVLMLVAIMMSFGLHVLFTKLLVIDLP